MKPRGPLMVEHRLIEKMLVLAEKEADNIKSGKADAVLIDAFVDFFRVYADRTHHGKEEDILFKVLADRELNDADKIRMEELISEHKQARQGVGDLYAANLRYKNGDASAAADIHEKLLFLIGFYPVHIQKEDDVFFPDTEKYFSAAELDRMLLDFWEFDRKMIHEKYARVYESLSAKV